MKDRTKRSALFLSLFAIGIAFGAEGRFENDKFRQLEELLPTPNIYRTASGAPGHEYWQQQVDYEIDVELDDENQRIIGSERITYHNNSPDTLRYLWVQLDANIFAPESHAVLTSLAPNMESASYRSIEGMLERQTFDGSAKITAILDGRGNPMAATINDTMMRVDLDRPLEPGRSMRFSIDWNYEINNSKIVRGRTGYEYFEDDQNYLYEIAQWYPRLAAYTDVNGWQNKQFLGSGEFTLEFGDYKVNITVPDDHIVASTGVLQNADSVLTSEQRKRLEEAENTDTPMFIVTPEEAKNNETSSSKRTKTWTFKAEDVRDFAFASSRKFIWDAQRKDVGGKPVWAMSYYPNEGEPLWSRYSTHAIVHTLDVYSKFTFDYPYPVAISVNGPVGGMEYPMICFNGPRPEKDGTYSKRSKYGLISVIIHEVGHNWFPMIVNSDERQWTWMDEGLNTFLQYLAEQEWESEYPSWRGEPQNIVGYMTSERQVPIMTNSDSLLQFGSNAYAKPATALNILRETVMGRELFDFAFKEYSNRWRFKRPEPSDLFRTMEDASAVDLDWFWNGWFFTTDHTDISIESLTRYEIDTQDPEIEKPLAKAKRKERPETLSHRRNAALPKRTEAYPILADFYNTYEELDVRESDIESYERLIKGLSEKELGVLNSELNFYVVDLENLGGLVMPVILAVNYEDGSTEEIRVPAELWRRNAEKVSKLILSPKVIHSLTLDPYGETADADTYNNFYPRQMEEKRIKLSKRRRPRGGGENPMQAALKAEEKKAKAAEAGAKKDD